MDHKKIGAFIAQERKAKNLTQEQFAEKIFVSAKTVSKWENGRGLPDTYLLSPICEIFGITLNELLSGERLEGEHYKEKAEDHITDLLAERRTNGQKIVFSVICFFVCFSVTLLCICLTQCLEMPVWLQACLIVYGVAVLIFGLCVAIYYDIKVGSFECKKCGKKFTPSATAYILSPHTVTTRLLKCPHCGKRSFCKKRITGQEKTQ